MIKNRYVLTCENIFTMDAKKTKATAIAVENKIIIKVGSKEELKGLINNGWPEISLNDKAVLPGFIDTHGHMMMTGLQLTGINLADAKSINEVLCACKDLSQPIDKKTWIRGYSLNEQELAEKRMPDRYDLDQISKDQPICLMHSTLHLCVLNTIGLKQLEIPNNLPGLDIDPTTNQPTGVIRDPGIISHVFPALNKQIPKSMKIEALKQAARMALDQGITTLHALDGGDFGPGDTRIIWENRDLLPMDLVCYNQSMDLSQVHELGLPRVGGCICADGAFEAHTAALFEPYADDPDNYGDLTYSQKEMDEFIQSAHKQGYQIAIHCESEASIEQVLWAMEKALRQFPRKDHRHRIEHLELPTFNQLERMAKAGIIASMQPGFIPAFIGQKKMEHYERLLGKSRLKRVHPYQKILSLGIPLCGGSDSPVTPYAPLSGIQAAMMHPNSSQRLNLTQALEMFTSTAAFAGFEEKKKGSIEPGKQADFVILEQDPFKTPVEDIANIPVWATIVQGKTAHPQRLKLPETL